MSDTRRERHYAGRPEKVVGTRASQHEVRPRAGSSCAGEGIQKWAQAHGDELVAVVTDDGISGTRDACRSAFLSLSRVTLDPELQGRETALAATILKLRLFLGSYSVLFAILAIRFSGQRLAVGCAALALFGFFDNWRITHVVASRGPYGFKVEDVRDQGSEVAGYLATYLLPFVTTSEPSTRDLLGYALFLGLTCLVYVRSEMVQINPVMYLLGRRIVGIRTSDGPWIHLITRDVPEVGDAVDAVPLRGKAVMLEVDRNASS